MSLTIACPACGKFLRVEDIMVGRQVQCGACSNAFVANPGAAPGPWDDPRAWQPRGPGGKAVASLTLGILSLVCWYLPIVGLPMTITGLVLGIKDHHSSKPGMAVAGIVTNIIGLVLSVINAAVGAYLGATGQHPLLHQ
jgi:hypothetical protein